VAGTRRWRVIKAIDHGHQDDGRVRRILSGAGFGER
jgi:hypothetical protein